MLSLSPLTLLPCSPLEMIDVALDAGFDAIGIRLFPVLSTDIDVMADRALQKTILQRLSTIDLKVLDVDVVRISPNTDVSALEPALAYACDLGARYITLTATLRSEWKPDEEKDAVRKLRHLCEIAARYDVQPAIEFMVFRGIGTLEHALEIVRLVDHPNLRICLDALHFQRSGGTLEMLKTIDPSLFSCFQICDAPTDVPADVAKEARFGRLYPGEGGLPLPELLAILPADLPVAVEAPALSHAKRSLRDRAHEVARRTRELMAARPA
jgi:sugar phosphate isomerase/epimerase